MKADNIINLEAYEIWRSSKHCLDRANDAREVFRSMKIRKL